MHTRRRERMAKEVKDIRADVGAQLAKIAPRVIEKVSISLVDRGLGKRADAIVNCIDKLEKEESELKKIDRPDSILHDREGKIIDEAFTKKRSDDIKKIEARIQKLTKSINKAIETGDYADVYNLAAGKDQGTGNPEDKAGDNSDNS
jgi:hypothetical protein